MKLQKLKICTISLLIIYTMLLSSCSIVNGQKYVQIYGDAITYSSVSPYAKYVNTTNDNFNEKFNEKLYTTLILRVSNTGVLMNEESTKELESVIDDFRRDEIVYKVVKFDENTMKGVVKISVSDIYPKFLVEMNKRTSDENYDKYITDSLLSAFKNSKRTDIIEVEVKLEYDYEKDIYFFSEGISQRIVEIILGI